MPRSQTTRDTFFLSRSRWVGEVIQSCKDLNLGRIVCYKTLRPEFVDDPYENKLFLREARITGVSASQHRSGL